MLSFNANIRSEVPRTHKSALKIFSAYLCVIGDVYTQSWCKSYWTAFVNILTKPVL